ncbi:Soluble scavenger receptor cysteine-rich domain-containing protein SSC5D [Myotis brandtii]|uniref:Soluble scavenger receptor cysteine-rich domain-containing protein SSC5D n=1 Tax=Myotis brandtii TaxID=109478 RepID=S7MNS5_MYOBR|nr:Soluble scavenger receptor cysteine-rich domain-containing protein SSC5D [Myotis brandtii]
MGRSRTDLCAEEEGRPEEGRLQVRACSPGRGAAMAPGHLSVREMREDEKALVLEMLKAGVKDTENRVALHALTRPPTLLLLAAASSGLRFVLASFALALLLPPADSRSPLPKFSASRRLLRGVSVCSPQLRLVAGPSRCSGRLEVWHAGRWGTVCDDSWDPRDSAVVCRELGCGGARQPDPSAGRFGWGSGPIWLDDVACVGTEASLLDCPAAPWGKHNCAHNEDVGVMCTGTPGLDSIADPFSWSWLPGLGRDPDAWLPGEPATKPPEGLSPSVPERTTQAPGKMPKSTKKWVTKHPKRPATPAPRTPTTKHSRSPGTRGPPELSSRTTASLTTEAPRKLTSHTSTTPTPRAPWERTSKTVTMMTTQDPGEVTSLSPVEPSAKTPAEGPSESSKDPAPSPTGGSPGGSGPFRVRLADGPNRCAGRLEVWHAGLWGTVCDDKWDLRDSTVACGELGCGRVRPRVGKTHYGPGTGPIWLDDVGCKGTEASLSDCPAGPWGQHNCGHEEDVVLTCTGHADEEDYPAWTWDPTSGEDLAQGTPAAGAPGHTASWGSTRSPGVPSPEMRRLPGPVTASSAGPGLLDPGTLLLQSAPTEYLRPSA